MMISFKDCLFVHLTIITLLYKLLSLGYRIKLGIFSSLSMSSIFSVKTKKPDVSNMILN